MNAKIQNILNRFICGEKLSSQELNDLRKVFAEKEYRAEINRWLENNWEFAASDDLEISFDNLRTKIHEYESAKNGFYRRLRVYSKQFQRVAVILFIPLLFGILFYYLKINSGDSSFYVAEAPFGEKAKIELADGSIVWLNSGSKIRYSADFNRKSRDLELDGEAFFEVKKQNGKPFIVHTSQLQVKVTGTSFNVSAYSDDPFIETSLVEGKVNIQLGSKNRNIELSPGNAITYTKQSREVFQHKMNEEAATAWRYNRLIFINDNFSKLARKIEKWYNVEVVYNPEQFQNHKLTVKLLEGEQLSNLLQIIETTVGAKCTVDGNKIRIIKI